MPGLVLLCRRRREEGFSRYPVLRDSATGRGDRLGLVLLCPSVQEIRLHGPGHNNNNRSIARATNDQETQLQVRRRVRGKGTTCPRPATRIPWRLATSKKEATFVTSAACTCETKAALSTRQLVSIKVACRRKKTLPS